MFTILLHFFRDVVDVELSSSNNQSNVALGLTSSNEEFYLNTIYLLITFIGAYLLISFALIFILVKRSRQNSNYSPIEVVSKDLKQSPPPHSPTVVRKSASRTRVFSGSKSKSRSRSKHKNDSREPSKTCSNHVSETKENNLNVAWNYKTLLTYRVRQSAEIQSRWLVTLLLIYQLYAIPMLKHLRPAMIIIVSPSLQTNKQQNEPKICLKTTKAY